ncbi:recombination protein NinB [Novilysobacter erysipheiresistens]|uniref:Recombination protein NinB n=1 Tax=Novilysobacter erysipheiresistens TaxID=1749332 RepID=A0ABU7YUA5_9GAMM
MKQRFIIERKNPRRADVLARAHRALDEAARDGDVMAVFDEVKRTLDQNAAMWPALTDFARQVAWPVTQRDGTVKQATPDDMKDVMTAAFEEETRMAPGLRGGFVMLGARTSKYGKKKMGDFLTFLRAEGNDRGVVWSEKANDKFEEYIGGRQAA